MKKLSKLFLVRDGARKIFV